MKNVPTDIPYEPLERQLGVCGAVMMGMGAMVGTGVFVSIGVAAGVGGAAVVLAIPVAAGVAVCNALSSAQLAASHPVSGGTYAYGYRYLTPTLGFTAGWMFLCAKSASAATAALGFGGYFLHALGVSGSAALPYAGALVAIIVTLLVLSGLKRSHAVNVLVVSITVGALFLFICLAGPSALNLPNPNLEGAFPRDRAAFRAFLEACALMFVAFTGYGRVATLGEEVKAPRTTIPLAILAVTAVSTLLYSAVGLAAVGAYGAEALGEATREQAAPLETVLRALGHPAAASIVALGAMTAMLGVLLNLILGLSRVALAMGRQGDLPAVFAKVHPVRSTPVAAVLGVGVLVSVLTLSGDVKLTWSFSAFTVLVYYAITNLAALRLPPEARLFPRWVSMAGIAACLFLAVWVDRSVWITGLGVLAAGLIGRRAMRGR